MKARSCFVGIVAVLGVFAGASQAFAQQFNEFGASNLTLKKTYLKSASEDVTAAPGEFRPIFSPTEISCTGNGDCLVQVQLAATVDVHPGDYLAVKVTVDGQRFQPFTNSDATLTFPLEDFEVYSTRGFTWVQQVTPGTHTIVLEARSNVNYSTLGGRTLTVSVFK